jgi:esterase/lipase superfamily enzyme
MTGWYNDSACRARLVKVTTMRRLLAALVATLTVTGCAGVDYGKVPHSALVADPRCDPRPVADTDEAQARTLPYFLVTSRLPDCRTAPVSLTGWRSDRVRYGRFGNAAPAAKGKSPRIPLALSAESDWWSALARDAAAHDGRVLVYVHGFNETFDSSGTDTGQIARMTGAAGPVVHYSWPSVGKLTGYLVDETNMYWDERNFRNFLARLARAPWTKEIVLVGHSLGGRLAIPAVEYVDQTSERADSSNISNIVLLSPDVDRADFERDIAEEVLAARRVDNDRRITLYVSARDRALAISRQLHGYARLGSPFCDNPFVRKAMKQGGLPARCYPRKTIYDQAPAKSGFTVIDTTEVSGGGTGHSDFLKSGPVCRDFAAVVGGRLTGGGDRVASALPHVFGLRAGAGLEVCGK